MGVGDWIQYSVSHLRRSIKNREIVVVHFNVFRKDNNNIQVKVIIATRWTLNYFTWCACKLLTTNLSGCAWMAISHVSFFSNGKSGWSLSSPPHAPPAHEFLMVQFSCRRGLKWKAMSLSSSEPVRKFIANLQDNDRMSFSKSSILNLNLFLNSLF